MQGNHDRTQSNIKQARTLKDLKFTEEEYQKFKSGAHTQLYEKFGAHYCQVSVDTVDGVFVEREGERKGWARRGF